MEQKIDYGKKWSVMIAVGMGLFLGTIDGSIVNVALPTFVKDLETSFNVVQWVLLGYLLTIATLTVSVGRLADMIGKKPIYTTGFVIFTTGSVLCGLSPTVYMLIASRVIQAVGASMVFSLGMGIITESFPREERGKALGISGTLVSIGIIAGPTIGGMILSVASWHWIFFVNLPIGIIGTFMAIRNIPNLKPVGGQKFDIWGALSLGLGLFMLLIGMTWGQERGFNDPLIILLLSGFAVFFVMFIFIERRAEQPMVELAMFKNPAFTKGLITGLLTFIAIAGLSLLLPFYLENVIGLSPFHMGLMMAVDPILMGIISPISGWLSDRMGSRIITTVGIFILLIAYVLLSRLDETSSLGMIIFSLLFIGIGLGTFQSPNNSTIMGSAASDRLGVVSSILALSRSLGQTLGASVLGSIWAVYVLARVSVIPEAGAAGAPIKAQVAGFQITYVYMSVLIFIALLVAGWEFFKTKPKKS